MRFAFIHAHAAEHAIVTLCRVLAVSKAGYYAWRTRPESARRVADRRLTREIRAIHRQTQRRYGSPRITRELRAQGQRHSAKRIARLMRAEGMRAKTARRFRVTTTSAHAYPVAPNVLARQFEVHDAAGARPLNRVWAGDITYLWTREGWLFLAVLLDLASRRVIGWALRATLEGALTCDALAMALTTRGPTLGLVHHSDRGSQYAAHEYRALLATHGMTCSMSRVGNCWDNAVVESFFSTLKRELVHDADWATREEARRAIGEYIEVWYNRQRRHSSLGYLSPVMYELHHELNHVA